MKETRPRLIWPMLPRRISTRCAGASQFTRQTSIAALSQRPSRISASVMRSERSAPSASWASTASSEPARISEALKPQSGSNSVPAKASGRSWSVKPKTAPSARVDAPAPCERGGAAVEMRLQSGGQGLHRRTSTSGMEVIEPSRSISRVTGSSSVSKRTGTSNSKPAVTETPAPGAAAKVTSPVRGVDRPAGG